MSEESSTLDDGKLMRMVRKAICDDEKQYVNLAFSRNEFEEFLKLLSELQRKVFEAEE